MNSLNRVTQQCISNGAENRTTLKQSLQDSIMWIGLNKDSEMLNGLIKDKVILNTAKVFELDFYIFLALLTKWHKFRIIRALLIIIIIIALVTVISR